jgi:AraC-like DNA-binding protein
MSYSHLATATNILWRLLEEYGHDPEPLYRYAGIDPESLKKPGMRVRYTSVEKIWKKAVEIIDDPCFGLQAPKFWHPSYLHALGYAWLASHSLREALTRFVRYLRVVTEEGSLKLEEEPEGLTLTLDLSPAMKRIPEQIDLTMALIIHMCRINYGEDLKPIVVNFVHPEPSCSEAYYALFNAPVRFSAVRDSITFSFTDVDQHLLGANPHLARINDQVMINYLANLEKENIIHRVKTGIIDLLPSGGVADEKVAKTLGMSVRSLQRKLSEAGTTFRTLLDEIRKELALSYVRDPNIELVEIAFLLGFSEQSAFSRAFKRLTGTSPSEVRSAC